MGWLGTPWGFQEGGEIQLAHNTVQSIVRNSQALGQTHARPVDLALGRREQLLPSRWRYGTCPLLIPNQWVGRWMQQPWDNGRAPALGQERCRGELHCSFSDSLLLSRVEVFSNLPD